MQYQIKNGFDISQETTYTNYTATNECEWPTNYIRITPASIQPSYYKLPLSQ